MPTSSGVSALAIDPVDPNTLYAGTHGDGVLKSTDAGASWTPFNDGLTNFDINALAIDASGNFLHAGTPAGVFDIQLSVNQIDEAQFFVRQHYLDFLSREPDQMGWDYWTERITSCGSDQLCIHNRRIAVSDAFFFEPEVQQTGSYILRLYRASLMATISHSPTRIPAIHLLPSTQGQTFV